MTDREALAAALVGSGLIARYREYAHEAHPGTMQPDMGSELSDDWADAILAALAAAGYVIVKAEDVERLRGAIDAELALIVPSNGPFESGAAAAYHWVLAVLSGSTKP